MPMHIVETILRPLTAKLTIANNSDPELATERIDFAFPLSALKDPQSQRQLGQPDDHFVSEVRLAILRYARDAIGVEIQRLSELAGRSR